jgi:hypothetical protein
MIRHRKIPEVAETMPDRVQLVPPIHVQRAFSKKGDKLLIFLLICSCMSDPVP